jgi:hypothetical protein
MIFGHGWLWSQYNCRRGKGCQQRTNNIGFRNGNETPCQIERTSKHFVTKAGKSLSFGSVGRGILTPLIANCGHSWTANHNPDKPRASILRVGFHLSRILWSPSCLPDAPFSPVLSPPPCVPPPSTAQALPPPPQPSSTSCTPDSVSIFSGLDCAIP